MSPPLVSVSIPTLNSAKTIDKALQAIKRQTYLSIETIIVDAYSSDSTVKIAREYGAKVFFARGLTKQRFKCINESKGKYMLLLDSDQVITETLIEKCVAKLEQVNFLDALILRDTSVRLIDGFIARAQSKYMEVSQSDHHPYYGTALPRFFRADILRNVPRPRHEIGYFDHAWIYARCVERGAKIGYIDAVAYHLEYNHPAILAKKFFKQYGHFIVPAIIEDWKLVFGKSLPKKIFVKTHPSNFTELADLSLLYGTKVLFTFLGTLHSLIMNLIFVSQKAMRRK